MINISKDSVNALIGLGLTWGMVVVGTFAGYSLGRKDRKPSASELMKARAIGEAQGLKYTLDSLKDIASKIDDSKSEDDE